MNHIEDQLRAALPRQLPPEGFAERVLAATKRRPEKARWAALFTWPRWAAAAAIVLCLATGLEYRHQRAERLAGEAARRQVMQALRITGAKLQLVQSKVQRVETNRSE